MDALIGYTGLVGSTIREKLSFSTTELYRSTNINDIQGKSFRNVYFAGVPAVKWMANKFPDEDITIINGLKDVLKTVTCEQFILISTIDVHDHKFPKQNEDVVHVSNEPYGSHRYGFEEFIKEQFDNTYIFRLPALFGLGLKKNILFDLMNDNCLTNVNVNSKLQWYNLQWLYPDIQKCLYFGIKTVNLYPEPIETIDIINMFFPGKIDKLTSSKRVVYDHDTRYTMFRRSRYVVLNSLKSYIDFDTKSKKNVIEQRLTVSNLAWDISDDEYAIFILNRYGIKNVELVCTKYGPWTLWDNTTIENVKKIYSDFNIVSVQAVLYGIPGDLKNDEETIVNHLEFVSSLCDKLGISVIVYGSPKTRINITLDDLGRILESVGSSKICLEPNDIGYGCEVGVNFNECVEAVRDRQIYLNFDTGNSLMAGDDCPDEFDKIKHIQISAPQLKKISRRTYERIQKYSPVWENTKCKISLEMKLENILDLPEQLFSFISAI